nr:TonB-dependent receptor [Ignavibacteriaceae bacterium]
MRKLIFISLLLISVILPQNASNLEIVVKDAVSGEKLQGAVIKFENLPFTGVTDTEGKFVLRSIPTGEWRVICSFVGYKTTKQSITIQEENNKSEILMYNDQVQISEIIVTGTRAEDKGSSATYSNLDKLEIERISVNKDIPSILNQLPSTSYYSESGTGIGYGYIRIRGFDQRRISVLINGVPQNDPEDHSVYWINFYDLANSLEDVQVQRGSSLSFYGPPAIGASINLVT